jgi:hypothetical protein
MIYEETRYALKCFLEHVLRDAVSYMEVWTCFGVGGSLSLQERTAEDCHSDGRSV